MEYLGLMILYAGCLVFGFGLKGLSRLSLPFLLSRLAGPSRGPRHRQARRNADMGAPDPAHPALTSGPGIARKFKVFFLFQTLMLTLAYWSLPGLALFFLALFAFAVREILALQRRTAYPPGYGFRFGRAYGLLGAFGFSLLSLLVFAWKAVGTTTPPGGGAPFLAFVFLLLAVADGYAQITGQILGGPKIVPCLSPGKTWSGFLGGIVFCAGASVLGNLCLFGFLDAPRAATLGALIGVLAFLGDISASWVKRGMGLKDFSDLLGPQGGVLDRGDSLIGLGPLLWLAWAAGLLKNLTL